MIIQSAMIFFKPAKKELMVYTRNFKTEVQKMYIEIHNKGGAHAAQLAYDHSIEMSEKNKYTTFSTAFKKYYERWKDARVSSFWEQFNSK